MTLTNENYFSKEAELEYMGSSQFKRFLQCEESALAMIRGDWVEEPSPSMLIGSYVDAYFSGDLDAFKTLNPSIFKRDGTLKADYEHANYIIERIKRDEMFSRYLSGGAQSIMTGEISGVPFKIKIDSYHIGKAIVDLKIIKDFAPVWNEELHTKIPFVEHWGYDYQAAIYQTVERNYLPFFIAAATKEKPEPDIGIFSIPQDRIDAKLYEVEELAPHFQALKRGHGTPTRCESCAYCRKTKRLTKIYDYREAI